MGYRYLFELAFPFHFLWLNTWKLICWIRDFRLHAAPSCGNTCWCLRRMLSHWFKPTALDRHPHFVDGDTESQTDRWSDPAMVTQAVNGGSGILWELECPARTLSWWITLFPCGSHSSHLCISCKHWFFLPLVTPSEFSLGSHIPHSPPSPPQPCDLGNTDMPCTLPILCRVDIQPPWSQWIHTTKAVQWEFPFYLKQSELCLSRAPKGLQVNTGPWWNWIFITCFLLTHWAQVMWGHQRLAKSHHCAWFQPSQMNSCWMNKTPTWFNGPLSKLEGYWVQEIWILWPSPPDRPSPPPSFKA